MIIPPKIRDIKVLKKFELFPHLSSFWVTCTFFAFVFLFVMSFTIQNFYSSTIMNDGDTLFFLSFVKNLSNCELHLTNGLMLNAVNDTCLPFISGGNYEFYRDHPTGSLVPYVIADKLIDLSVVGSRLISILITLTYILLLLWIIKQYWSLQFIPVIVCFSIPVLWYHSIVLHIFVQTAIFSLLTAHLFIKRASKNFSAFIPILALFAISFLMDWAAFILAIVVSSIPLFRREFSKFTALVTLSILSYFLIRKWLEYKSGKLGLHSGLGVFGEQNFSLNSVINASLQLGRSLGIGLIFIILGFLILFKDLNKRRITGIDLLSLILFFQGILFVYVFINWSSGHSYWCYFLIPTAVIEGVRVLKWVREKFCFKIFSVVAVTTLVVSLTYSGIWWYGDYIKKPISYSDYFQGNDLPSDFLANQSLYSNSANVMNGQGFKARYELQRQLMNFRDYKVGNGGYFIANSLIELRDFQSESSIMLKNKPIYLNWFEWWVVKLP